MPSGNILFPVDDVHEAGDCVMQCLAAFKKAMHVDPRHAGGKQYRVPLRAKNLTTYLSGISVMVINGNRSAGVQRRAEKRPLPSPFGDLGVGASLGHLHESGRERIGRTDCICTYIASMLDTKTGEWVPFLREKAG